MNTVNNYDLDLYNGDIGFILENAGSRQVIFTTSDGGFRILQLSDLTGYESAYAMTIHKSQGSEYDEVFVVYVNAPGRSDYRLLYTAVTRAKNLATILELI